MALIIIRNRKMEIVTAKPVAIEVRETRPLDDIATALIERFPNLLIPWHLMSSLLYYQHDLSLVTDGMFDDICRNLDTHWDDLEHMHKHVVDREAVRAGTGYYINMENCPLMTQAAASHMAKVEWGISVPIRAA